MASWRDAPVVEDAPARAAWMDAPVIEDVAPPAPAAIDPVTERPRPSLMPQPVRPDYRPETIARGELAAKRGLVLARGGDPNNLPPEPSTPEEMAAAGGIRATPKFFSSERLSQVAPRAYNAVSEKVRQAAQLPGDVFLSAAQPFDLPDDVPEGKKLSPKSAFEVGILSTKNDQNLWDWDRSAPSLSADLDARGDADQLMVRRFAESVQKHNRIQKALQDSKTERKSTLGKFGQEVAETAGPMLQSMMANVIPNVGTMGAYDFWLRQGYGNFMGEGLKRYNVDATTLNSDQVRKLDSTAKDLAAIYAGVEFIQRAIPGAPGAKLAEMVTKRFPAFNNLFTRYIGRGVGEAIEEGIQKVVQEAFDKQVADIVGVNRGANGIMGRKLTGSAKNPNNVGDIPKTDVWNLTKVGTEEALRALPVVLAIGLPGIVTDRAETAREAKGLINPEAQAEAQAQQVAASEPVTPELTPEPAAEPVQEPVQLPVSEPAAPAQSEADLIADIASGLPAEYPEDVRMQFAQLVVNDGEDAADAFLADFEQQQEPAQVGAKMGLNATLRPQYEDAPAMLAAQERYPVLPEAELRADQRYKQYRDAGYTDREAMQFVQQDQKDDTVSKPQQGERNEQRTEARSSPETAEGQARPTAAAPGSEARPEAGGRDSEAVPSVPGDTGRPGGPVQPGEGGRGAEGGAVPVEAAESGAAPEAAPAAAPVAAKPEGESATVTPEEASAILGLRDSEPIPSILGGGAMQTINLHRMSVARWEQIQAKAKQAGWEASMSAELPDGTVKPSLRRIATSTDTAAQDDIEAKFAELSVTSGHNVEYVRSQYQAIVEKQGVAKANELLENTLKRYRPKNAEFKGVSTTKPAAQLTDAELETVIAPDSAAMKERNVELGRYEDDPRFYAPVPGIEGAIHTDFRAVRDFLRDGTLSERGKTVTAISEMVRSRMSQDVAKGVQFKTAGHILTAIETGKYGSILHPDNPASRAVFAELTGVTLPAGVSATKSIFQGKPFAYNLSGKTAAKPEPAGITKIKEITKRKKKGITLNNPPPDGWKESDNVRKLVGKNTDGEEIRVDDKGARSIVSNGVRQTQPVTITPRGPQIPGIEELYRTGRTNYLTTEELAKFQETDDRDARRKQRMALMERFANLQRDEVISKPDRETVAALFRDTDKDLISSAETLKKIENALNNIEKPSPQPVKSPVSNLSDTDAARLKAIQDKIRAKLRGQANMGVMMDPELLTLAGEMAGLYVKGGVKTFRQFAAKVKADMADAWDGLKIYLHSAWQAAGAVDQTLDDVSRAEAKGVVDEMDQGATVEAPARATAQDFVVLIEQGKTITKPDAAAIAAKHYGGTMASGAFNEKQLTDIIEMAVNMYIAKNPTLFSPSGATADQAREAIRTLDTLLGRLPTQSVRSAESAQMQQFSTVPTFGYLVSWVANVQSNDVALEPSAGLGGLAVFPKTAGATVIANELSEGRRAMLEETGIPDTTLGENAEHLHAILTPKIKDGTIRKPTVVVMNPPFSNAALSGQKTAMIGAQHVDEALALLPAGGRLVAILGKGRYEDSASFKAWIAKVGKNNTIRAVVTLSGEGYRKYGTTYDNRLIVIDKVAPPADHSPVTGTFARYEDAVGALEGVRNERQPASAEPSSPATGEKGPSGPPSGSSGVPTGGIGARPPGRPSGRPSTGKRPTAKPGAKQPATPPGQRIDAGRPPDTTTPGTRPEDSGRTDAGAASGTGVTLAAGDVDAKRELGDGVFSRYVPTKVKIAGAITHPTPLVESTAMAAIELPNPTYKPNIPKEVVTTGTLSDAQLEQIVYAGQAHAKKLPSGERIGYFIGDGTGVGKGRTNGGIFMDNWRQGRRKAVWVSKTGNLVKDARRDIDAVFTAGGMDSNVVVDTRKGPGLKVAKQGIAFITYSSLAKGNPGIDPHTNELRPSDPNAKAPRIQQLVDWLGKDFDGVIVFDEVHLAGNAIELKGKRGRKLPSDRALAVVDLQRALPNARIVYSSATGATDITNLSYADRLGLWGHGTAFSDKRDFFNQIQTGGLSAMEIVAQNLKAMGRYLARTLSFDGVGQKQLVHNLSDDQLQLYDQLSGGWQKVMEVLEDIMARTGANQNSRARSAARSALFGAQQRFYNQVLTAMQMPSVIDAMESDIEAGHAIILQIVNTNEATQERAIAKAAAEDEDMDLESLDLSPKDLLLQYVNQIPVVKFEPVIDDQGNTRWVMVVDAEGNPVEDPEAVRARDDLLLRLQTLKTPENPLEMVLNHFGSQNVAEITGRSRRVVYKKNDAGATEKVIESRSEAVRALEAQEYQDDKRKILIFSDAGGTGFTYSSDRKAINQRRRMHYLLQAGWRADGALQGFGRSHRANQTIPPFYALVSTNIKGHQRFISTIARRLAQLGAITSGERKAASGGLFNESNNLETDYAEDAIDTLFHDLFHNSVEGFNFAEITQRLGYTRRVMDDHTGEFVNQSTLLDKDGQLEEAKIPYVSQFLNRVLILTVDEQNRLFDAFSDRLQHRIEQARFDGTFDPGMQLLDAKDIRITSDEIVYEHPESAAKTRLIDVDADEEVDVREWDRVKNADRIIKNKRSGKLYAQSAAPPITDRRGRVEDAVFLVPLAGPRRKERVYQVETGEDGNYDELDKKAGKKAWDQAFDLEPKIQTVPHTYVAGTFLPIWDRIGIPSPKMWRVPVTATGETFIGIEVPQDQIPATRSRLGAGRGAQRTPEAVFNAILDDGETIDLANGWHVKRSFVGGDYRIEVKGIPYNQIREFTDFLGGYTEKRGFESRFFIPTDRVKGVEVVKKMLEKSPIVEDGGATQKYRRLEPGQEGQVTDEQIRRETDRIREIQNARIATQRDAQRGSATQEASNEVRPYQGERLIQTVRAIEGVYQKFGFNLIPVSGLGDSYGYTDPARRNVVIDFDREGGVAHTAQHELTHVMWETSDARVQRVMDGFDEESGNFSDFMREHKDKYPQDWNMAQRLAAERSKTTEEFVRNVTAFYVEEYLAEAVVSREATSFRDQDALQALRDYIRGEIPSNLVEKELNSDGTGSEGTAGQGVSEVLGNTPSGESEGLPMRSDQRRSSKIPMRVDERGGVREVSALYEEDASGASSGADMARTDEGGKNNKGVGAELFGTSSIQGTSRQQDAEYLAAVERGDMETAQRMVDEAAKARIDAAIEEARAKYDYVGVRSTDDPAQTDSRKWDDGYPTEETLGGLSVSDASTNWAKHHIGKDQSGSGYYLGKFVQVVASNERMDGEDVDESVLVNPVIIRTINTPRTGVTRDESGRVIPLSQRFNERSPDIRYRRLAPASRARQEALAQARAKLATFRKGTSNASTIRGVVGAAETAGEREVRDSAALLKTALKPQFKKAQGNALARLDDIHLGLTLLQADVDATKGNDAKAEEARRGLAKTLFPKALEQRRVLAQYRPVKLLKSLLDQAEKRIRTTKLYAVQNAVKRYSAMNANERSKAYRDLTSAGQAAMNRWLDMANLMPLADVPVLQPKLVSDTTLDPDNNLVNGAGTIVGRLEEDLGITLTDPAYVDLRTLYATLQDIEREAGVRAKERKAQIEAKARTDSSLVIDDIKNIGRLPDYDETSTDRLASGEMPAERVSWVKGKATKFRSIMRMVGHRSHLYNVLTNMLRKGDSQAKGQVVKARRDLEAVMSGLGVDREMEHSWRTTKRLIKLPGVQTPIGFTNAELIDIYNQLQDPGSREILLAAGAVAQTKDRISPDSRKAEDNRTLFRYVERIVRAEPKLLKVAEAMQEIIVKYGQNANQVSQYFTGNDEFTNEFYWPRSPERKAQITTDDDQINNARNAVSANIKNAGLAKRRVKHGNPLKIRDGFSVFDDHIGDISRYTYLTIPANEMLNAFTTSIKRGDTGPDNTTALRQFQLAFGDQYKGYIGNGLRAIMAGEVEKPDSGILRGIQKIGRRISGSTLALSASAILQNRYGGMANMAAWLRSRLPGDQKRLAQVASDFARIGILPQGLKGTEVKALLENGYLDDRWSGQSLRLALMGGDMDVSNWRVMREFASWTDKLNRPLVAREMAVSVAAYKALVKNGFTSEEAVDLIEQANRDTQNSTSELDKSQIAREIQQIFSSWFPFTSQGLVQWDFYIDTMRQAKQESWPMNDPRIVAAATAATLNLFLLSMLIAAMMRLLRKEDPLENPPAAGLEAAMQAFEQRVPVARIGTEAASAAINGWRTGPINMVERTFADAANSIGKIVRGKGNYQDAIALTSNVAKALGLPVGGMTQYFKILLAQAGAETKGMKDRKKDRFFKDRMKNLPESMSTAELREQADMMREQAERKGIIPGEYSAADFRASVRGRYKGTITDAKPKKLSDY